MYFWYIRADIVIDSEVCILSSSSSPLCEQLSLLARSLLGEFPYKELAPVLMEPKAKIRNHCDLGFFGPFFLRVYEEPD